MHTYKYDNLKLFRTTFSNNVIVKRKMAQTLYATSKNINEAQDASFMITIFFLLKLEKY